MSIISPLNMCYSGKQWYIQYLLDLLNNPVKFQRWIRTQELSHDDLQSDTSTRSLSNLALVSSSVRPYTCYFSVFIFSLNQHVIFLLLLRHDAGLLPEWLVYPTLKGVTQACNCPAKPTIEFRHHYTLHEKALRSGSQSLLVAEMRSFQTISQDAVSKQKARKQKFS